jgi:hypothetical protein
LTVGPALAATSYQVNYGASLPIDEFGTCKVVTNNHASGLAIFVPTATSAEWASFYNGLPGGVNAGQCECPGSPTPGTACPDGTLYAGLSPDGDVPMYTTLANAPYTAPSTLKWGPYGDTAMTNCANAPGVETTCKTGEANTALLAGIGATFAAATYCDTLVEDGHSDWYLPSEAELNVLYVNRAYFGFPNVGYWSSSERTSTYAWAQFIASSGGFVQGDKPGTSYATRCVRK